MICLLIIYTTAFVKWSLIFAKWKGQVFSFFFKEVMMSDLMQSSFSPRQYISFLIFWDYWQRDVHNCLYIFLTFFFFFVIGLELSISHISQVFLRSSILKYSAWLVSQSGWAWTLQTVFELKNLSAKMSVSRKLCCFVQINRG